MMLIRARSSSGMFSKLFCEDKSDERWKGENDTHALFVYSSGPGAIRGKKVRALSNKLAISIIIWEFPGLTFWSHDYTSGDY